MRLIVAWFFAFSVPALLAVALGVTAAQDGGLPTPDAPLALAAGGQVTLAFKLPPERKPDRIVIYRSVPGASGFAEIAAIDATQLSWVDAEVELGRTYRYAVRTRRGAAQSELSAAVEVLVGGAARIVYLGGSLERALFEVVLFRDGRRLSARFVHKPGEEIGDLAWIEQINATVDFRLGPRLASLTLGESEADETIRRQLTDERGHALTGPSGRPIELPFRAPGPRIEAVLARIEHGEDAAELRDGEAFEVR